MEMVNGRRISGGMLPERRLWYTTIVCAVITAIVLLLGLSLGLGESLHITFLYDMLYNAGFWLPSAAVMLVVLIISVVALVLNFDYESSFAGLIKWLSVGGDNSGV